MDYFLELFFGGLTRGSIYALIALGYTMVYGIIQLINFAHGEIYMIGAFVALIVAGICTIYGMSGVSILILAGVIAVIYACAYGYTLEKVAYRPLRGAPRLSPLISAIGMSIFLQNYVLLVQTPDFLPFPRLIPDFDFMEPVAHIIGSPELVILVTTLVTMILLTLLIKKTRVGKAMRATQQDMKYGPAGGGERRSDHFPDFCHRFGVGRDRRGPGGFLHRPGQLLYRFPGRS